MGKRAAVAAAGAAAAAVGYRLKITMSNTVRTIESSSEPPQPRRSLKKRNMAVGTRVAHGKPGSGTRLAHAPLDASCQSQCAWAWWLVLDTSDPQIRHA